MIHYMYVLRSRRNLLVMKVPEEEGEHRSPAKSPMFRRSAKSCHVMTHLRKFPSCMTNRDTDSFISSLQKIHPAAARWHTPFHSCAFQGYCRKRCCIRSFCLGPTVPLFSSTKAYKQHIHFLPQSQSQSQGAQRREARGARREAFLFG